MSEAITASSDMLPPQYSEKWRERLFYQYKLYVDTITRLHTREHLGLTLFMIVNGFLMFATIMSLGVQVFIKLYWLDLPFISLGVLTSIGYIVYSWRLHVRYSSMIANTREMEHELPASLTLYNNPTGLYIKALQFATPWLFLGAYVYIYLSMHVFVRTMI